MIEELLEYLVKSLVERPDEVRIERVEQAGTVLLRVHVASEDVGKVIGRQGRIVRSLRTVVRAAGARAGDRVQLEVVTD